jgi:glucokinase
MPPVLAVDFGGTKTSLAIVEEDGAVRARRKVAAGRTLGESVDQVAAALAPSWWGPASTGIRPGAVGLIVPGIYTPESGRAWCPNLWGPEEVPLADGLRPRLGSTNLVVDSDRAGYVLGETWLGAGRGLRHVVFVAIGTGIGVGILADGVILRGAHGIAGAAGWMALSPEWKEIYRQVGCWEGEAAGPAVARAGGEADAASVVARARAGEPRACEALAGAARYVAMGVANLISLLDPELVVLGGGLGQGAGDLLIDDVRRLVPRWAQPVAASHCRIELTKLGEDAGLFGAARLALGEVGRREAEGGMP